MNCGTSGSVEARPQPQLLDGDLQARFFNTLVIERGAEFVVKVTVGGASNARLTEACKIALTAQTLDDLLPQVYPLLRQLKPLGDVEFVLLPAGGMCHKSGHDEVGLRIRTALRLPACRSWVDPLHCLPCIWPSPSAVVVRMPEGSVEVFWRVDSSGLENGAAAEMLHAFWKAHFEPKGQYATTCEVGLPKRGEAHEYALQVILPPAGLAAAEMALYGWSDFRRR